MNSNYISELESPHRRKADVGKVEKRPHILSVQSTPRLKQVL